MNKNPIIISNFHKGAAESYVLGKAAIVGCDIFDEPGVLKPANTPEIAAAALASDKGVPVSYSVSNGGTMHLVQQEGRINIFYNGVINTPFTTYDYGGMSDSLPIKIQYINGSSLTIDGFVFSLSESLGFIRIPSFNSITMPVIQYSSLTAGVKIQLLDGKDGYIYFTHGNKVGRFGTVNFDYTTGAWSATGYTANALDLPPGEVITCIRNFNSYIVLGTESGRLYFWDRTSSSFIRPIEMFERINALLSYNNRLYVSAGARGNIYIADGTNFAKIKTIPYTKNKKFSSTCRVYPNAMAINQSGNLLVGTSTQGDATPNTTTLHGVWEIELSVGYPAHLAYLDAQNTKGQTSPIYIGFIKSGEGGDSSTMFGVSLTAGTPLNHFLRTTARRATNYTAYVESELFTVGTRDSRRSFNNVTFILSKPFEAGQGIRISYRKNTESTYTTVGEFTHTALGSVLSHSAKALIAEAEILQVKVELLQGYGNAYYKDLSLLQVILT